METRLLGYLLNALEEEETRRVDELLIASEAIRQQLEVLRYALLPLGIDKRHEPPPADLAVRTCLHLRRVRRNEP